MDGFADAASSDGSLPDILGTNVAAQTHYLAHLTALDLPTLLAEPAALQTQAHHLTSSLTSLTHTSYNTFLSLHQTTSSFSSSLDSLQSSLENLLTESLPALEDSAAQWRDRTDKVLLDRRKARVVLEQHDKLRDLLEIPMLIDTCVRNGYFAEALSLAAHARSLSAGTKNPPLVLSSVLSEVQNSITHMLLSLLATLHDPSRKLPALWKAVNFLRKMEVFGASSEEGVQPEEQIALAFLGGREACLRAWLEGPSRDILRLVGNSGSLGEKDREELALDLRKYIDVWREHFNDIVTQFSTIFLERSPATAHTPITPSRPLSSLHPLLTKYTTHVLSTHLFPVLSQTLPLLTTSAIATALRQLTYCSTAFARHGLDFRGSLRGLFCRVVSGTASADLKSVGGKWVERLKTISGDGSSGPLSPTLSSASRKTKLKPPSQWLIIPALVASPPTPTGQEKLNPPHVPPQILVSYPPMAEHTNAVLTVLNGLRHLASVDIFTELTTALDGMLAECGDAVLGYARRVCDGASLKEDAQEQEEKIVLAAAEVYFTVLLPYVRRALVEGLYGIPLSSWEVDAPACHQRLLMAGIQPHFMALSRLARTRTLVASLLPVALVQFHSFYLHLSPPTDALYIPHHYFLVLIFAIQLSLQCFWLYQIFRQPYTRRRTRRRRSRQVLVLRLHEQDEELQPLEDNGEDSNSRDIDDIAEPTQIAYAPIYALCNLLFVGAAVAWNLQQLVVSHVFAFLNTAGQLYFIFAVLSKYSLTRRNRLTHVVAKTNAGFSILYLARAWGVLGIGASRPLIQQQANLAVLFLLLTFASGPDPTVGLCLVLDLAALAAGNQNEEWRIAFAAIVGVLFIVIVADYFLSLNRRKTNTHLEPSHFEYRDSEQIYLSDIRTPTPTEITFPSTGLRAA
ncbi:Dor1-like family-domain-containing protein [Mycena amicta]|nr:Dor1-like family-domain-containing protein [Mycena amicta]